MFRTWTSQLSYITEKKIRIIEKKFLILSI